MVPAILVKPLEIPKQEAANIILGKIKTLIA